MLKIAKKNLLSVLKESGFAKDIMRLLNMNSTDLKWNEFQDKVRKNNHDWIMKTYFPLFILLFLFGCAQEAQQEIYETDPIEKGPAIEKRIPDYPIVAIQNEFQDLNPITNGVNYWKTETALNSTVRIGSGTCFIHDVWNYGKNCHTDDITKVSDIFPTQIYRLNIGQIHLGDVFEVLSQYEVTNNTFITVMYADTVILSANPNETQNFKGFKNTGNDPIIAPGNGYNCTPSLHHCVMNKIGTFMVTQEILDHIGTNDAYVIVLFWSQNIRWKENLTLDVDSHKGC